MEHSFNINAAKEVGIAPAILLNNIYWWVRRNELNDRNSRDGYYWTYNSTKALCEYFPYMTQRQIVYALTKLSEGGYILTGNYNKSAYDRTKWYTITEKGKCLLQDCEIHCTKLSNGFSENVEPIPDNKNKIENIDAENVEQSSTIPYKEIIDYLNSVVGTNYKVSSKDTQKHISARVREGYTVHDFKVVIDVKYKEWGKDKKMFQYLRPSTLFGTKFESYLSQAKVSSTIPVIRREAFDPVRDADSLARDENGELIVF